MSRSINESITQLETSLSDIKTSLTNKKVEMGGVEQLKVSEVSGYIDQVEAGGSGFNYIENVTFDSKSISSSAIKSAVVLDDPISFNLTFTPKEDGLLILCHNSLSVAPNIGHAYNPLGKLEKGTEYTITGSSMSTMFVFIFKGSDNYNINFNLIEPIDSIVKIVY